MRFDTGGIEVEILPRRFWHSKPPEIVDIFIDSADIKLEQNHFLTVAVTYATGITKSLMGRVVKNGVTGTWAIDAISHDGGQVALRILE